MTPAQRDLWHADRGAAHPSAFHLQGRLYAPEWKAAHLQRVLDRLIADHPSLRTLFAHEDGVAVQRVLPAHSVPVRTRLGPVDEIAADERERAFDLARAPGVRMCIVRDPSRPDQALVLTVHHLHADGLALQVLVSQLREGLERLGGGQALEPQPSTVDLVSLAREACSAENEAFWHTELSGLRQPTLPGRPARSGLGVCARARLDGERLAGLRVASRRAGLRVPQLVLGMIAAVVHRWQPRAAPFALGVVVGHRDRRTIRAVGHLASVLPLRLELGDDERLSEVASRCATRLAVAMRRGRVDLGRVRREIPHHLRPAAHLADVRVVDQSAVLRRLGDLVLDTPDGMPAEAATCALKIVYGVDQDGLQLYVVGDRARFEDGVQGVLDTLVSGIDQLAEDPAVGSLRLMPESCVERVRAWGDGGPGPGVGLPTDLLDERVKMGPTTLALIDGERTWTRAQLLAAADAMARGWRGARGIAIACPRSAEAILAMVGAARAAVPWVALPPDLPRLAERAEELEVDLLLTAEGVTPLRSFPISQSRPGPETIAYRVATSGSTGASKTVEIRHRNLHNTLVGVCGRAPIEGARVLHKTPLCFDSAIGEVWHALVGGGIVVLAPEGEERDPPALARRIAAERIDVIKAVPALLRALVRQPEFRGAPPQLVVSAGAPLSADLAAELLGLGVEVHNFYGPAECAVTATTQRVVDGQVHLGRPLPGTRIDLVDAVGERVPVGVIGEVVLCGAGVGAGYLRSGEAGGRFGPGARYHTGDLARWDARGQLHFCGRRDLELNVGGARLSPEVVEAVAAPLVGDCAAVAVGGSVVLAHAGGPECDGPVRAALARELPSSAVVHRVRSLPSLPRLVSGKLDRRALVALLQVPRSGRPPRTALESLLAAGFARVLGRDQVDANADLFALGGDSLAVAELSDWVGRRSGRAVPLQLIFANPVLADLAAALEAEQAPRPREVVLPEPVRRRLGVARSRTEPRLLITGANGFLGRHLVIEAVRRGLSVIALVRGEEDAHARSRLARALSQAGQPLPPSVEVIAGDLGRERLGLPSRVWDRLAREASHIVHAGARVHHADAYTNLAPVNVDGTRRILELAATGAHTAVHVVSSCEVLRPGSPSAYGLTKRHAESLASQARAAGGEISIHRVSLLLGPESSGVIPVRDYWPAAFIHLCAQLGRVPSAGLPGVHVAPVDLVARSILDALPSSGLHTWESANPVCGADLVAAFLGAGVGVRSVPMQAWRRALASCGDPRATLLAELIDRGGRAPAGGALEGGTRALSATVRFVLDQAPLTARSIEEAG